MKHNPKLHERIAALPGNARLHPAQDPERAQGALQLMYELQGALAEIAGLPHVSLQPSAGSHGELAGVLLTRAYHEAPTASTPHKVLTPDTAHGTNPATVTMAGYEVVKVGTDDQGGVDMDDLKANLDEDVACLMLTNPNTLGVFDTNIEEIAKLVHGVGATLYYDGANLNAVMGRARPGDMGFDIVHYNLHKTFTQPHGGGGPGAGPIAVSDRIEPFLPRPAGGQAGRRVRASTSTARKSIGRLRGFQGNYGVFVRSYAYILSLGGDGLQEASETAVLNANYLLARLKEKGIAEHLPVAYDRICMHEFVLSGAPMKKNLGLKTLDLAKRLLDYGYPPADGLLPAARRRGAADRADRDGDQGDARRVRRRDRRDPARGRRGSGDRPQRAVHDAGAPPGRGRRRQAAGDPPGHGLNRPVTQALTRARARRRRRGARQRDVNPYPSKEGPMSQAPHGRRRGPDLVRRRTRRRRHRVRGQDPAKTPLTKKVAHHRQQGLQGHLHDRALRALATASSSPSARSRASSARTARPRSPPLRVRMPASRPAPARPPRARSCRTRPRTPARCSTSCSARSTSTCSGLVVRTNQINVLHRRRPRRRQPARQPAVRDHRHPEPGRRARPAHRRAEPAHRRAERDPRARPHHPGDGRRRGRGPLALIGTAGCGGPRSVPCGPA